MAAWPMPWFSVSVGHPLFVPRGPCLHGLHLLCVLGRLTLMNCISGLLCLLASRKVPPMGKLAEWGGRGKRNVQDAFSRFPPYQGTTGWMSPVPKLTASVLSPLWVLVSSPRPGLGWSDLRKFARLRVLHYLCYIS